MWDRAYKKKGEKGMVGYIFFKIVFTEFNLRFL